MFLKKFENFQNNLTDLELLNLYVDTCLDFCEPRMLREIQNRNLYDVINHLPNNKEEAKSIVYARLAKKGKFTGNTDIDTFKSVLDRIEFLKQKIYSLSVTKINELDETTVELSKLILRLKNYFKESSNRDLNLKDF